MDNRFKYLDNVIIMEEFRAVYNSDWFVSKKQFEVHVVGFRKLFSHVVDVPSGAPCVFIQFFYDSVDVGLIDGIKRVPPCTMVIFEPNQALFFGRSDISWRHSWIRCSGALLPGILKENAIAYNTPVLFDSADMNEEFLLNIHKELHHPKGADDRNVEDIFRVGMRNVRREQANSKEAVPENFLKAKQFIELNYQKHLTLNDIAKTCFVSRSHLCKGFQKYFGVSPLDYAIRLRHQYSLELLKDINLNLSEIAVQSGYSDVFYFSRMFKKHTGTSPSQYRKASTQGSIHI